MTHVISAIFALFLTTGTLSAQADYVEGEALVIFQPRLKKEAAENALKRNALKLDKHFAKISAQSGRVTGFVKSKRLTTRQLIARLESHPEVASAEPNHLRRISTTPPDDSNFTDLWGMQNTGQSINGTAGTTGVDINFLPAWQLARQSSSQIVIGVVDTGVDYAHPDLAPNIWLNPGEIDGNGIDDDGNGYVDDIRGYDFVNGSPNVFDSSDHGTHISGTIAGVGKNAIGIIGVNYRAKILPLKTSADGETISSSAAIAAYDYAIALKQRGVNIVALNASFGGRSYSAAEASAVSALGSNGIILCAAAGNETSDNDVTPSYPANYTSANVISVASIAKDGTLSEFSNYGANTVDIAAPGTGIYSTIPLDMAPSENSTSAGGVDFPTAEIRYSASTSPSGVSGTFHLCGIGNPGDFPPQVAGNIALIQRGSLTFAQKVSNAMAAGAIAAVIYDHTEDPLSSQWTLGQPTPSIPALHITKVSGEAIVSALPTTGHVKNYRDVSLAYQFLSGTSMATPHVAGAIAFAAMNHPQENMTARLSRVLNNVTPMAELAGITTSGGRLNLLKMTDPDSDGLPDWWEIDEVGTLQLNALDDPDGDGVSNLHEFLAGSNPDNPSSQFSLSSQAVIQDSALTSFSLSFPSLLGRNYQVEWSETLQSGSWQPLTAMMPGTGATIQVQDSEAARSTKRRFYRATVALE